MENWGLISNSSPLCAVIFVSKIIANVIYTADMIALEEKKKAI